jgi:plasmid stabilization system protein ParE
MTGRYVRSPQAQIDLDKIWDRTAEWWGTNPTHSFGNSPRYPLS